MPNASISAPASAMSPAGTPVRGSWPRALDVSVGVPPGCAEPDADPDPLVGDAAAGALVVGVLFFFF
jgi:hypothetical protein